MSEDIANYLPLGGSVLGALCLLGAMRANKRKRLVDNLPTSKTTGVFIGLVELKGSAECVAPLTSYLAQQSCVYYSWTVEEHWSRTVTETYTDSDGKTKTRTRHESGWTTVASGHERTPFYLQDDCGVILVRPEGATVEPQSVFSYQCGPLDPLYYGKGPLLGVADSDHRRRFCESAVPLHCALYVLGQSREREDVVAAEIAYDKKAPMFLISTRDEAQVSRGYGWAIWLWWIFGLLLWVGGWLYFAAQGMQQNPLAMWIAGFLSAGAFAGLSGLGWIWMVYNSMVELTQRVSQGWAQVDVQLKRRHDLIPNLVGAVKGLASHEADLQTELAQLRTQLHATAPGEEGPEFDGCSRLVVSVAEKYPELKAQEGFLKLQRELSDTENRIALARGYFNEIASHYNARLEVMPDALVARLAHLTPRRLLEAGQFERAVVDVKLCQDAPQPQPVDETAQSSQA